MDAGAFDAALGEAAVAVAKNLFALSALRGAFDEWRTIRHGMAVTDLHAEQRATMRIWRWKAMNRRRELQKQASMVNYAVQRFVQWALYVPFSRWRYRLMVRRERRSQQEAARPSLDLSLDAAAMVEGGRPCTPGASRRTPAMHGREGRSVTAVTSMHRTVAATRTTTATAGYSAQHARAAVGVGRPGAPDAHPMIPRGADEHRAPSPAVVRALAGAPDRLQVRLPPPSPAR